MEGVLAAPFTLPRLRDFPEHRNLRPASYSFLQVHGIRSDLQQATSERDGDCMGAIISLQFIHQVFDVEVNRGFRN